MIWIVFVRLSVCPFVRLSVCPFVSLSVCPFISLSYLLFCFRLLENRIEGLDADLASSKANNDAIREENNQLKVNVFSYK